MSVNNLIGIALIVFIALLAISTVLVFVTLMKEIKLAKSDRKNSQKEEAEAN